MLDTNKIFKIGIGTWGIGGFAERNNSIDEAKQIEALTYMINKGMNFVEANMWYSQGYSVEILAKALKASGVKREDIFICQAIYLKENKTFEQSKTELSRLFELFKTDYVDTIQFSMGSFLQSTFEEITDWIFMLLETKATRYTSITNADLALLKSYHSKFKDKFFSHEVVFNFEVRQMEELGIIPYGQENNIKTVVYQPLRRNRTALHNWEPVVKLAEKYQKTQNQILLNWIVAKGYLPLTKSENLEHIDEHLAALDFKLENEYKQLLDNFRITDYTAPPIDWNHSGIGVSIDQLSNIFDEEYKKQTF